MIRPLFLHRLLGKGVMHIEAPHLFMGQIVAHIKKHKPKCYCLTPVNYDAIKCANYTTMSREEYAKFLQYFYLQLKDLGADLQPHLHLAMNLGDMPEDEIYEKIIDVWRFFITSLDITPTEILFGHYTSNKVCEKYAKMLHLKIIGRHWHIYDWWLK